MSFVDTIVFGVSGAVGILLLYGSYKIISDQEFLPRLLAQKIPKPKKGDWVDPNRVRGKPCPICKKEMSFEHNMFSFHWMCENTKCKAYLRRHGAVQYSPGGKIEKDW